MSYLFRKWTKEDRLPSNWAGKPPPDNSYVLFYNDEQVGTAIMGYEGPNNIFFIEIFEPYRKSGHGRYFVEKIAEELKNKGYSDITAFPVIDETVWTRLGFNVEKVIDGDKLLKKNL